MESVIHHCHMKHDCVFSSFELLCNYGCPHTNKHCFCKYWGSDYICTKILQVVWIRTNMQMFLNPLFLGEKKRNVQFLDSSKFIAAFISPAINTDSHTHTNICAYMFCMWPWHMICSPVAWELRHTLKLLGGRTTVSVLTVCLIQVAENDTGIIFSNRSFSFQVYKLLVHINPCWNLIRHTSQQTCQPYF